ncbi:MAG: molybdopterin cofactor-binding domain-containing protein [Anaerolineae bacterium]
MGRGRNSTSTPGRSCRRGVEFACGFKNVGYSFGFPEQSWATVELYGRTEIDRVVVRHGGAEVVKARTPSWRRLRRKQLSVPFEKIHFIGHDTAETQTAGSASASRMTFIAGGQCH